MIYSRDFAKGLSTVLGSTAPLGLAALMADNALASTISGPSFFISLMAKNFSRRKLPNAAGLIRDSDLSVPDKQAALEQVARE